MSVKRGDVVLVPLPFTSGTGGRLDLPWWFSRIKTTSD